ncbi:MAG: ferrous iron transport protein A [Clostridia bacterium]|nr:ferrous iron transport protein A [Clostridia bacterium]
MKKLNELKLSQKAKINKILTSGDMRRRFIDIGLIENTVVECVGISPQGDPKAYLIRGAVIAIRNEDSKEILIQEI